MPRLPRVPAWDSSNPAQPAAMRLPPSFSTCIPAACRPSRADASSLTCSQTKAAGPVSLGDRGLIFFGAYFFFLPLLFFFAGFFLAAFFFPAFFAGRFAFL